MTTTAKDIIQAAAARRTANDPQKLFAKPEMIRVLSRRIRAIYATLAQKYPVFMAADSTVECTENGWPHPTSLFFAFMVETVEVAGNGVVFDLTEADLSYIIALEGLSDGAYATMQELLDDYGFTMQELEDYLSDTYTSEQLLPLPGVSEEGITVVGGRSVAIVPLTDKEAEEGVPRIYELNRYFHSVGAATDPVESGESGTGEPLKFFGPFRHPKLDDTKAWDHADNTLSETWPEDYNDLLVAELSRYLAIKDGRGEDELSELDREIAELTALLMAEASTAREFNRARRWTDQPGE